MPEPLPETIDMAARTAALTARKTAASAQAASSPSAWTPSGACWSCSMPTASPRPFASSTKTYDFSAGKRGPIVPPASGQTSTTIRLDDEVVDWFRRQVNDAGGGDYQAMINAALREQIRRREGTDLADTLRQVIREELRAAG